VSRVTGGFPVGPDGRVHGTFTHNPSSLRLSMHDPNLQNIPRGADPNNPLPKYVKEMFVAPPGSTFWARDFSGIEAVLVGYFAGAKGYTRLAKRDVHSFYTAYAINALDPARFNANDLPSIEWDDDKLFTRLEEIKREFKADRNGLFKHLVHGANYLQSPKGASETIFKTTGKAFDIKLISSVMEVYFELFPEIRAWHKDLCQRVDGTKRRKGGEGERPDPWTIGVAHVSNPFGYVHRFYNVLEWEKIGDEWISSYGEDAKRLISFLPQSTAAAIIKRAGRILWEEYPWVGQTMRLWIHDEILGECEDEELEKCLSVSQTVMESPIPELPLDPAWGMGTHLSIGTESKVGRTWAAMN